MTKSKKRKHYIAPTHYYTWCRFGCEVYLSTLWVSCLIQICRRLCHCCFSYTGIFSNQVVGVVFLHRNAQQVAMLTNVALVCTCRHFHCPTLAECVKARRRRAVNRSCSPCGGCHSFSFHTSGRLSSDTRASSFNSIWSSVIRLTKDKHRTGRCNGHPLCYYFSGISWSHSLTDKLAVTVSEAKKL